MIDGVDRVENRLEEAENRKLRNCNEVRLLLHDIGLDFYLDTPVSDIALSMEDELSGDEPSLKDAYGQATRAVTHHAISDLPQHKINEAYERTAKLLETGERLPQEDELVESTLESRAYELTERGGEEYWDGERHYLREMMEGRGLTAVGR